MNNQASKYIVEEVPVFETYLLRHSVLRPHQSIQQVKYPGDTSHQSCHFAISDRSNTMKSIVGIVSLYKESLVIPQVGLAFNLDTKRIKWRIRGIAVDPEYRQKGLGSLLLTACLKQAIQEENESRIWCNVRINAIPFYQRNKFKTVTSEFEIPEIGKHVVMVSI